MRLYKGKGARLYREMGMQALNSSTQVAEPEALGSSTAVRIHDIIKKLLSGFLLTFLLTTAIFIFVSQGAYASMSLTAFAANPDTDTTVRLDWSSVPDTRIYRLSRSGGSGADTVIDIDVNTSLNPLTLTDTGLQPETTYTYTIRAFSGDQPSILLDEKTAVVTTTKIIRPYNIRAVYDINARSVQLTWKSSKLAAGSTIIRNQNGMETSFTISDTSSAAIPVIGMNTVMLTISSTGVDPLVSSRLFQSLKSDPVTVIPVEPPVIHASSTSGTATITWPYFPQIGQFRLERSQWNGTSWGVWNDIRASLSGQSATDIPEAGGQYRYRLAAISDGSYLGCSSISETVKVLPAPKDLSLSIINTSRIDLSWTNGIGNTGSIQVLRRAGDGSYTQIVLLPASATSHSDAVTVTTGSSYTYRVRSYDESTANYSNAAEASISAVLPNVPASLRANVSNSEIVLNWADSSNNEDGFTIERMADTGVFASIGSVPANTTTYTDTSVSAGHTYIYRVRSHNVIGNSAWSNEVTINAWDSIAPASLTVTPVSSGRIDLVWTYTGTAGYSTIIERKTGTDGAWAAIYTTARGTLRYSDTGLSPNTRYFYRIRKSLGTGAFGVSYPNNEVGEGAYTLLGTLSLSGSAASGNSIYLTWSGNSIDADVVIERKMANGSFNALSTASYSTTGWYDNTGLVPGASYTYRIKAKSSTNESNYSSEITIHNYYLNSPSGLSVSVNTASAIELKWTDNSQDETGFEIWRYTSGSSTYALYATVDRNITTYTDTFVQTGVQYYYMVRAYAAEENLYSSFSNTATTGAGLISPPSGLDYTYISGTQIQLHWTDTSDNESGFKLEWKIGESGTWSVMAWLSANTSNYNVYNLNTYTKYYFRVRAYNYAGNADSLSEEIPVSTSKPAAPTDLKAIALSSSRVRITWKDLSDSEEGFRILRKPANAYGYIAIANVGRDAVSYTDNSLLPNTEYYYKVVSYNATGSSESSETEVKTHARVTFSDLGGDASWAREAVESLAGMGIANGIAKGLYGPGNTMSKAEFTAMVIRAFKLDTAPVGSFADVKPDKWYYKEVMIAENFGIISGDSRNRFYPESAITREEIAVILFKAMEVSKKEYTSHGNSALEKFIDRDMISPYAIASMSILVGEGIMEGFPGNTLGPKRTATRAEAAVFLYRAMNS